MRAKKSFALIQILIWVIIAVGIIGFLVPATYEISNILKSIKTRLDIDEIRRGIIKMYDDTNCFPTSLTQLVVNTGISGYNGPYVSFSTETVQEDRFGEKYEYYLDVPTSCAFQNPSSHAHVGLVLSKGRNKTYESTFPPLNLQGDDIGIEVYLEDVEEKKIRLTKEKLGRIAKLAEEKFLYLCSQVQSQRSNKNPEFPLRNFFQDFTTTDLGVGSEYLQDEWGNPISFNQDYDPSGDNDPVFEALITSTHYGVLYSVQALGVCPTVECNQTCRPQRSRNIKNTTGANYALCSFEIAGESCGDWNNKANYSATCGERVEVLNSKTDTTRRNIICWNRCDFSDTSCGTWGENCNCSSLPCTNCK